MQLERGEQIGAFEVEALVGTGGMAEVWAVRHTLLGSRHALKVFFEHSPRIHREARAVSEIEHDNLLPIEELITIQGRPALLMPLVEGPTLEALMQTQRLSQQEAIALTIGITRGLQAAHGVGLVHRDLKPANVLIDQLSGRLTPRIMDFGLVKLDGDDIQTRADMAMGTPAYSAPEQLRDARTATTRSDLWSVGVILCELLTGGRPFSGSALSAVVRQHSQPPSLERVPDAIRPIIADLLRVDPEERTPTAGVLLERLVPLLTTEPLGLDSDLAAAIQEHITNIRPVADSMDSLWTWSGGTSAEDEITSTIAPSPSTPPPEVQGRPWTDRYTLERELGRGGMAVVWRAWDVRLGAWRAIKILQPQLTSTAVRRRFELEARTMARLAHRGIVTIHDIAEHSGQLFIVMEWLSGGTLSERIKHIAPLSPRQAVAVIAEILDALSVAHGAGIVHRDVKPSNILLDAEGRPALTDFGIARVGAVEAGLTRTGMALGTLTFMAPEQRVDARTVDHRADLYAAGATLWTALTGRSPLLFVAPESEGELRESVPAVLADIIQTATRYRPDDRFADAASMKAALLAALEVLPEETDVVPLALDEEDALPAITSVPVSEGDETWSGAVSVSVDDEAPAEAERAAELDSGQDEAEPGSAEPGSAELDSAEPGSAEPAVISESVERPSRLPWAVAAAALLGAVGVSVGPSLLAEPVEALPEVPPVVTDVPPVEAPPEEPPPEEAPPEEPPEEPVVAEPPPEEPVAQPEPAAAPPAERPAVVETLPEEPVVEEPAGQPVAPGRIAVTGDGQDVQIVDASGRSHQPGEVPPGTYTVRVWFPNRHASGQTTVTVAAGGSVTVNCNEAFAQCQ